MGISTSNDDGFPEHGQDDPDAAEPQFKNRTSAPEDFSEELEEVASEETEDSNEEE